MAELILVRHSTVEINPAVPSHQWTLSAEGRSGCLRLAKALIRHQPALFVTSTEPKAVETGQVIADAIGVPWKQAENLHEHERRGTSHFPSREDFQQAVIRMFRQPDELSLGDETANQARERFEKGVRSVVSEHATKKIGIVSHGTVITLLLCHHNPKLEATSFWKSLTLPCFFLVSLPDFRLIARQDAR